MELTCDLVILCLRTCNVDGCIATGYCQYFEFLKTVEVQYTYAKPLLV